jgi:hypothetical protein
MQRTVTFCCAYHDALCLLLRHDRACHYNKTLTMGFGMNAASLAERCWRSRSNLPLLKRPLLMFLCFDAFGSNASTQRRVALDASSGVLCWVGSYNVSVPCALPFSRRTVFLFVRFASGLHKLAGVYSFSGPIIEVLTSVVFQLRLPYSRTTTLQCVHSPS